jgi:hypothetical protein
MKVVQNFGGEDMKGKYHSEDLLVDGKILR